MALIVQATIRNMADTSASDGFDDGHYDKLVKAEEQAVLVTVDCEACEGYYDITLPDGTEVPALSWYHLDGFGSCGVQL